MSNNNGLGIGLIVQPPTIKYVDLILALKLLEQLNFFSYQSTSAGGSTYVEAGPTINNGVAGSEEIHRNLLELSPETEVSLHAQPVKIAVADPESVCLMLLEWLRKNTSCGGRYEKTDEGVILIVSDILSTPILFLEAMF